MAYATTNELASYLGVAVDDLAPDAERLLERASELADYLSKGSIDTDNTVHMDGARSAVCSQVEFWLSMGETDIGGQLSGYSIGSFSVQFDGEGANSFKNQVSPRAKRHLFLAGLLNRSVGLK